MKIETSVSMEIFSINWCILFNDDHFPPSFLFDFLYRLHTEVHVHMSWPPRRAYEKKISTYFCFFSVLFPVFWTVFIPLVGFLTMGIWTDWAYYIFIELKDN